MPRSPRVDLKDQIYHVINRANARLKIFKDDQDYLLFQNTLFEAVERFGINLYSFSIMPNHFHFELSPKEDGQISKFMHWLTMTFTQRYHIKNRTIGNGHLFQGRYKAFMVETNTYFLQLMLYIERNPLRARLVKRSEDWKWSSLWIRLFGRNEQKKFLSSLPIDLPKNYLVLVNQIDKEEMLEKVRLSITKGLPFGSAVWQQAVVEKFSLHSTTRPSGRPLREER